MGVVVVDSPPSFPLLEPPSPIARHNSPSCAPVNPTYAGLAHCVGRYALDVTHTSATT